MTKSRAPPIICDVYNVVRQNALVKDSFWVRQREAYYEQSGPSVEEILLCENNEVFEGGQSNFFMVKGDTVYTRGEGVLQGTVRSMVINLCQKLGIPLAMQAPMLSDISSWDACFLTSTSRFLMNIDRVRVGMVTWRLVMSRRMEWF